MIPGTVYLLHFSKPFGHARHYCGWTEDVDARVADHQCGRGANLVAHAIRAGITLTLARTWPGDRQIERKIKRAGGLGQYCPICRRLGENQRKRNRRS